jgi:signal transduction histidine kinase
MTTVASPTRDSGLIPIWLRNRWGLAAGTAGAYVLLYIAWTYFRWGGEAYAALISDLAFLPLSAFGALAAWRVAADRRLDRGLRRAWLLLGLAVFSQFLGDLIWFWLEGVRQLPVADWNYTPADFVYPWFYPLAVWGLLRLPNAPLRRNERLRFALDLATVLIAAWMVIWYFVVSPAAESAERDLPTQIVVALYPIGDLVVLGGSIAILFRRPDASTRSALVLFLVGLLCFVVTDLANAYVSLAGAYASGGWLDVGWVAAYFFFALAALRQPFLSRGSPTEQWSLHVLGVLSVVLPFAAILLGYGLLIYVAGFGSAAGARVRGLFVGAGLLTLALLGRQALALRENTRLNAELAAFSLELGQRVEDRTRALHRTREALYASQKMAGMGALAAEVVHEVGNPLNSIIAAGESLEHLLADGAPVDAESLNLYLPIITRNAWHAARIMQTLRTYSRGSAPELAPHNLADVVKDVLFLLRHQLEGWTDVRLIPEFEPGLPPVVCDRNQMAQVIINLLSNARDAMPGGGTITLRVRRAPNHGVALEVEDTGVGLDPESLQKIFDPFYTTKDVGKGSGLGLAIVSRIVRAHDGVVRAHSDGPGRGATFVVTLPRAGRGAGISSDG